MHYTYGHTWKSTALPIVKFCNYFSKLISAAKHPYSRLKNYLLILIFSLPTVAFAQQWTLMNTGVTNLLRSVFFINSSTGWICTEPVSPDNSLILKTTDGGTTWSIYNTGTFAAMRGVHFTDANHGIVCGFNGTILKSADGGATWNGVFSGSTQALRSLDFPSADTGFVCGGGGTMLKTTDGGTTWSTLSTGITTDLIQVRFSNNNVGYAVASNSSFVEGAVIKTTDGGNTWSTVYTNASTGLLALAINNEDTVYAGGKGENIYKTTDGGVSWNQVYAGISTYTLRDGFLSTNNNCRFVSNNILATNNDGASWSYDATANGQLFGIHFPNYYTGYAVGTAGILYKYTAPCPDLGDIGAVTGTTTACEDDTLNYTVPLNADDAYYEWTVPSESTILSGQGTNTVKVKAGDLSGIISVEAYNACDTTAASQISVTLHLLPPMPVITFDGVTLFSDAATGNQWYNENTAIPGATSQSYNPVQNGTYYVKVTNSFGCYIYSNSLDIIALEIENSVVLDDWEIFPNPANAICTVMFSKTTSANLTITSIEGKILQAIPLIHQPPVVIDLSGLEHGMYIIQLTDRNGKMSDLKKLIVE